jgi:hypothetical protein
MPYAVNLGPQVDKLISMCIEANDNNYGINEAVKWAKGFHFAADVTDRDWAELESLNFDLAELAKRRQDVRREFRFNRTRVEGWSDKDPNKPWLVKLINGIEIFTSPDFSPNLKPPALRKKYKLVSPAVNRMMFDLYEKGAVILLPTDKLVKEVKDIHFSPTNWAPKKGKEQGRPISDSSFLPDDCSPLNSLEVKTIVTREWGEIIHPTLQTLVEMVVRVAGKYGKENIWLWKMDLANAFGLLNILPSSVHLLANELTDNVTLLYIVGMFGWTGTPYAFDVITRSIRWGIREVIAGEADMYVDDVIGCSLRCDVDNDIIRATKVIRSLCGPDDELVGSPEMRESPNVIIDSVAGHKEVKGRKVDILGWEFNLDSWEVFIAEHNFHKAFYGFMTVDEDNKVSYRDMEKLASWASRYGMVARLMRPFIGGLHGSMKPYSNRNVSFLLEDGVKFDIRMWRSYLCIAYLRRGDFVRNIDSFLPRFPEITLQFDASLFGVGLILSGVSASGVSRNYALSLAFPFELGGDSAFQNVSEFLAVLAGVFLAAVLFGVRGKSITLLGDSVTALRWSKDEHYRGMRVRRASIAFTIIGSMMDYDIVETIHVPGVKNILCDHLSRDHTGQAYERLHDTGFQPVSEGTSIMVSELMEICNPIKPLDSPVEFKGFWERLYGFLIKRL